MDIDNLIKELIAKINAISRQKSLENTCKLASEHIVELFELDYAVISLFDFMQKKIVSNPLHYYGTNKKELGRQDPEKWVKESQYKETDKDIVPEVARQKRIVKVIGQHVFDKDKSELSASEKVITFESLNSDIFLPAGHDKLARFYLPIVHRELKKDGRIIDFSLGVIEVAIKEEYEGQFSTTDREEAAKNFDEVLRKKFPEIKELEHLFQLYTENFAQSCYYYIVEEESKRLGQEFTKLRSDPVTGADVPYRKYATDVIITLKNLLGIDWGIISFKTFDNNYINYLDKATFFSDKDLYSYLNEGVLKNRESLKVESMVQYVCTESFEPYFSDDVSKPNEKYLEAIDFPEPVHSEMIVPIFYEDELIGVADLYSTQYGYFNAIIAEIISRAMEVFAILYTSKKRQHAYKDMIRPAGAWNSSDEVYDQLIKLLADYYNTDKISLWVKNNANYNYAEFFLYKEADDNKKFISSFASVVSAPKKVTHDDNLKDVDIHTDFSRKGGFYEFCRESNFKFYISLCIRFNRRIELLVNIFSRLDIFKGAKNAEEADLIRKNYLGQQYEFLTQIVTKVSMTLQNVRITEALKTMSDPLTHESSDDLWPSELSKRIVKSAQLATGADIVSLFPFNRNQNEIRRRDVIASDGRVSQTEEKAVFANAIFYDTNNEKPLYIFDSIEECKEFLASCDPPEDSSDFQNSFREVNQIKSTCVVRLLFGNRPVGVIFFNYKTEQQLQANITLQQIILFFSSFAANHIYLNGELEFIKSEKNDLNKMYEKVVPLVTRTNFYIIVEGMSHVIKNAFAGIIDDFDFIDYLKGNDKKKFKERKDKIEHALELVESVLPILKFRDENSNKSYVDIPKIIRATINFFKIRNGDIDYTFESDPDIPDLLCQEAEFAMIIYNLMFNSITAIKKAERSEGRIHVEAAFSDDRQNCVITIEDNGIGIKHENDEKIYEADWSTKDKGTGLGLYYIRKTLEGYEGTIGHRSEYGKYARFILTIPVFNRYIR